MRSYSFSLSSGTPVRLYTITRVDGTVIRICDWDRPITVGSDTWNPQDGFKTYAITESNDGRPASTQIDISAVAGGTFDPTDIAAGVYDQALLEIDITNADNPVALDFDFIGKISVTQHPYYDWVTFEARNHYAFPIRQLVETYTLFCRHDLGDVFCGVDTSSFEASCTVNAVINLHNLTLTALPDTRASVDSWYNPGRITFTSGKNKNRSFRIGYWTASVFQVTTFLPIGINTAAGDTAIIRPNCDKTLTMCSSKFSNASRHGGFPRYAGAKAAATSDF